MEKVTSPLAKKLVEAHEPNQHAYLCAEIGLQRNTKTVADIDAAYAELLALGYVEQMMEQTFVVFSGGVPKHPFRLTDAGVRAKDELARASDE